MKKSLYLFLIFPIFTSLQAKRCPKPKTASIETKIEKKLVNIEKKLVKEVKQEVKQEVKKLEIKKEPKKNPITVVDITTFEKEVLKSKSPVIVDVFADWCGPCQRMAIVFEEVAEKFKDKKIKFMKIKMDSFEESDKHIKLLKEKLKVSITMIPTFLYIENGKLVKTIVGSQSADKFTSILNDLLKK